MLASSQASRIIAADAKVTQIEPHYAADNARLLAEFQAGKTVDDAPRG